MQKTEWDDWGKRFFLVDSLNLTMNHKYKKRKNEKKTVICEWHDKRWRKKNIMLSWRNSCQIIISMYKMVAHIIKLYFVFACNLQITTHISVKSMYHQLPHNQERCERSHTYAAIWSDIWYLLFLSLTVLFQAKWENE